LMAHAAETAQGVVIALDDAQPAVSLNSITLKGVHLQDLIAADFLF
jgi:hypothetical protein